MPLDAFAELQSYQQPTTGMALTGQQPATQPPVSPAEFQQRQQGWMNTFNEMLSNPVASTMLLQAGMSMLGGATGGEAVGDAMGAVGRGFELQGKQQQQDFANRLAQGRFEIDQQELDIRRQQLGMQQQLMQRRLAGGGGGGGGQGEGPDKMNEYYTSALRVGMASGLQGEELKKFATDAVKAKFLGMKMGAAGKPGEAMALSEMPLKDLYEMQSKYFEGEARAQPIADEIARRSGHPQAAPAPAGQQMPASGKEGRVRWGPQKMTSGGPIQQKNGRWDVGGRTPEIMDRNLRAVLEVAEPGDPVWNGNDFLFNLTPDMIAALRKKYGIQPGGQR